MREDQTDLDGELRELLGASAHPRLAGRRVATLRRRPSLYRSSYAIDELEVTLDDDNAELSMVCKDLSLAAMHEAARHAKPEFLYDPRREIAVYREILRDAGLGTAECYAAAVDESRDCYRLVLEKVEGVALYQFGTLETWRRAARWLRATHGAFAGRTGEVARRAPLLAHDGNYYARWLDRARAAAGAASANSLSAVLDRVARGYGRVIDRLLSLPATLIHGEFYASNVLVRHSSSHICPVDWEVAAVGPGLIDLAALTAGKWTDIERAELVAAYDADVAGDDLDCCRLHLAVQWLGWSARWTPPPAHANDWAAEAARCADRLGL